MKLPHSLVTAALAFTLALALPAAGPDLSKLKTFGTIGKQVTPLSVDAEAELFNYTGKGSLTHMWFGGGRKGCEQTRLRIYVDVVEVSGAGLRFTVCPEPAARALHPARP